MASKKEWLLRDERGMWVSAPCYGKTADKAEAKRFASELEAGIVAACMHAGDGLRYSLREVKA